MLMLHSVFTQHNIKQNYRIGKGKNLILVLVPAPVLMLASRSLHSYAFGTCACVTSENQPTSASFLSLIYT